MALGVCPVERWERKRLALWRSTRSVIGVFQTSGFALFGLALSEWDARLDSVPNDPGVEQVVLHSVLHKPDCACSVERTGKKARPR